MIVVAVSAGIDSMVLLDWLYQQGNEIVVAHVNYQKRKDSYLDALTIKSYLKGKDIQYEELVVAKEAYGQENFQAQARRLRYEFFEQVAKTYHTNQVYVAHHKDDFLETYLFKKKRLGLYNYYGIEDQIKYHNIEIYRPLLRYYKEDIKKYAVKKKIPYYEDSSNQELNYTRNRIREYLKTLSLIEKEKLYQEAMNLNEQTKKDIMFVKANLVNHLEKNIFLQWSRNCQLRWLFLQIKKYDITLKNLEDIIHKIQYSTNFQVTFLDTTIIKAYDIIYVLDKGLSDYCFSIMNDDDYDNFIDEWKKKYNYDIKKIAIAYPFVIRNYQVNDFDKMDLTYQKFRKKIKKNKIPFFLRDYLPVIEKGNKMVIFIF